MAPIDVVACYHGVFVGSGGDRYLDLRVGGGEPRELIADEGSMALLEKITTISKMQWLTSCPLNFLQRHSSESRDVCIGGRKLQRHSGNLLADGPIH